MNYLKCKTCFKEIEIELEYVGIKRDDPRGQERWVVCSQCGKNNSWSVSTMEWKK